MYILDLVRYEIISSGNVRSTSEFSILQFDSYAVPTASKIDFYID